MSNVLQVLTPPEHIVGDHVVLRDRQGDWYEFLNKDLNKIYFYNTRTNVTSWSRPQSVSLTSEESLRILKEPPGIAQVKAIEKSRKSSDAIFKEEMDDIIGEMEQEQKNLFQEDGRKKDIIAKIERDVQSLTPTRLSVAPNLTLQIPSKFDDVDVNNVSSPRKVVLDKTNVESPKSPLSPHTPGPTLQVQPLPQKKRSASIIEKAQSFFVRSPRSPIDDTKPLKKEGSLISRLGSLLSPRSVQKMEGNSTGGKSDNNVPTLKLPESHQSTTIQALVSPRIKTPYFGVSLHEIMKYPLESKNDIPLFLSKVLLVIKTNADTFGLFYMVDDITTLRKEIDTISAKTKFHKYSVHANTAVLVQFLKELPQKLIPSDIVASFEKVMQFEPKVILLALRQLVHKVYGPLYKNESNIVKHVIEMIAAVCQAGKKSKDTNKTPEKFAEFFLPLFFDYQRSNRALERELKRCLVLWIESYNKIYIGKEESCFDISDLQSFKPLKEGFQMKKSVKGKRGWYRVYFALFNGRLHIYNSNEDYMKGKTPKRIIILSENIMIYSVDEEEDHVNAYCIDLNGRSKVFESENSDDKFEWMTSLRNEISKKHEIGYNK